MKLLFDQNLSFRLPNLLQMHFPDSIHVKSLDFQQASDTKIWEYARANGYAIVSKDSDFHQRSLVVGAPPKVIWIQRGNCSTDEIQNMLTNHIGDIKRFISDPESTFLVLE